MAGLSDLADDERTARMVLSMLVEPNDPVTGRVLNGLGAMETLRLAERDGAVVGLSAVDAQVWRDHFDAPAAKEFAARLDQAQQSGIQVLVPGDANWSVVLNDLGDLAPYVLWTRGASSCLARPLHDFVTITGSRASTSHGDHVARELAAGGDTIAILANGVDRAPILLVTATCSNAWPMSGFSSARCRLVQFRQGIGSSLAGDYWRRSRLRRSLSRREAGWALWWWRVTLSSWVGAWGPYQAR